MALKTVETAISFPFSLDSYGNVAKTTDQSKIWADRVRSVIGTALGERVMRPEFGTNASVELFSGMSTAGESIKRSIYAAFATFLPMLTLSDVSVSSEEKEEGIVSVDITYGLPNEVEVTTTLGVAYISGNKPIYEEYS